MAGNFGVIIQKVEMAHVVYFLDSRVAESGSMRAIKHKVIDFLGKLQEPPLLIVDLQRVTYLASMGLSMFANIEKQVRQQQGKLVFCGVNPPLRELFHVTAMEKVLTVVADQKQAMKLLRPPLSPV